jgi:hypothetical protein
MTIKRKRRIKDFNAIFVSIMHLNLLLHLVVICTVGNVYMSGCNRPTKTKIRAPYAKVAFQKTN